MKITVPTLRDLAMLALGSGGMAHQLFFVPEPNMLRVGLSIGLLLGPAALYSIWRMRGQPEQPEQPDIGAGQSPPLSSSPPPGS